MKKIILLLVLVCLTVSASEAAVKTGKGKKATALVPSPVVEASKEAGAAKPISFKDLPPNHPAYPYVMKMVASYEVIAGYPDGTFRGKKTVNRAEFSKVGMNALYYLENQHQLTLADEPATKEVKFSDLKSKHWSFPFVLNLVSKYKIVSGYPNGTYKPNATITRFEFSAFLAKMVKLIYYRYDLTLPTPEAVQYSDVKRSHWAMPDIQLLVTCKIMNYDKSKGKKQAFRGMQAVSRYDVTVGIAKLIERVEAEISKIPAKKMDALRVKYGLKKIEVIGPALAPPSRVERSLQVASRPELSLSIGGGNIYEKDSGTNNWMGFFASATYGDTFSLLRLKGNYEITGRYGFNQVVYIVPVSGGGVSGGINNENRYEFEINTIYPVLQFLGITGKLLLGAKYINLNNPTAPTNFTGFNAGVVTSAGLFGRKFLLRGFYSLPLQRSTVSPSILGQPSQLFDYEASIDAVLFRLPLLLGFSGETMLLSGGSSRYYNNFFIRFFLF